jgi:Domain of unknown function (DUF4365)
MPIKEAWFVLERSEALASLLLGSRSDIYIRSERKTDEGIDFIVQLAPADPMTTRWFMVQVKGTLTSDKSLWMENAKQLFSVNNKQLYCPVCLFIIDVRTNNAEYSWIAEPLVQGDKAVLQFHQTGDFQPLNESVVDEIVKRVHGWYDVLPQQLLPQ